MHINVAVVLICITSWSSTTSFRSLPSIRSIGGHSSSNQRNEYDKTRQSRRMSLKMSSYNPRKTELKLGQSTAHRPLEEQLSAILFDLTIISTSAYLESVNKPTLEWFSSFLALLPPEDDENYEENVLNKLITAEAGLYEYTKRAETSPDVSMKFSYVIEPWMIAAQLISWKKTVRNEMRSLLPLVMQENNDAADYAFNKFKYGSAVRSKHILDSRDPSKKNRVVATYNKLNTFIANIALNRLEQQLKEDGNLTGLSLLSQTVWSLNDDSFQSIDLRGSKTAGMTSSDRPNQLLDILLQQGYRDLADQNIMHIQIEKVKLKDENDRIQKEKDEIEKNAENAENKNTEIIKSSKNKILRDKKLAEEHEALVTAISKVVSHNLAQDYMRHRSTACKTIDLLFDNLVDIENIQRQDELMLKNIKLRETPLSGSQSADVRTYGSTGESPSLIVENTGNKDDVLAAKNHADTVDAAWTLSRMTGINTENNGNSANNGNENENEDESKKYYEDELVNEENLAHYNDAAMRKIFTDNGGFFSKKEIARYNNHIKKVNEDIFNNAVINIKFNNNGNRNITNLNSENRTDTPVNAGRPYTISPASTDSTDGTDGTDSTDTPPGSILEDRVSNAISDLLGSIFKGFRGGDKVGDKGAEEMPPTASEPQGERVKQSVAIMDPPGSDLPPPPERPTERDNGDSDDAIEKRNPIDWGEEIPEGDLSAFLDLGPNARIRYVSQKEEMGKRYLYLEGKSAHREGVATKVIKQWINYDEAMEFLKNGFGNTDSDTTDSKITDSAAGNVKERKERDERNDDDTARIPTQSSKREERPLDDKRAQMM